MLIAWIGSALSPEPRLDRFLRSVSSGTRPRNALLIAAVTATAQAVESHADTAVTGSELPRTLLRDAIQGTDCVDILVIGDSNTAIHGFGWIGNATGIIGVGLLHDSLGSYSLAQGLGMAALTLGAILVWAVRLPPLASAPEQLRAG